MWNFLMQSWTFCVVCSFLSIGKFLNFILNSIIMDDTNNNKFFSSFRMKYLDS